MNSQNWNDALTLLCIMILADDKVYQEEVESFKKAAVALKNSVNPKLMLTEHMALDWFILHRDNIKTRMSSIYHKNTIASILKNLRMMPERKELLFALMKVALSDGHEHATEHKIIQQACETWKLDMAS